MNDRLVIKIGGSLLATPGAMKRVARWLDETRQEDQTRLLIAGGGPVVDGLRTIDQANPLPKTASHEAAIELMEANTRLLASWLPGLRLLAADDAKNTSPGDHALLVRAWLRDNEPSESGERLTAGWQTTSDAIAARLAACLGTGLIVVKHGAIGTYDSPDAAAAAGVVDPELPRVAPRVGRVLVTGLPE